MLTLLQLAEKKKTKVKINPSQKELTEKSKHEEDCTCIKCEERRDKDEPTCESVDLTEEWINASVEVASEYFYAEGINEDGLDQIINEVGLEDFVEFVIDPIEELNEERSARKASVKAPSYEKVKAAVDKSDAAKKKAGKGEYSKSYAKRSGETEDSTNYNDKAPAKKKAKPVAKATVRKPKAAPKKKAATVKKVEKAVKTAKKTQPQKPTSKKGLLGKVGDAVKKGVERHNKARAAGKVPEKRVKEFAKGFKKGVTGTLKFAGKVKKAVSEETVEVQEVEHNLLTFGEATRLKKEKGYDKGGTKKPSAKKDKALSFVLDKIRKEHGKGAVMTGGSRQQKKVKGAKSDAGTGKYKKAADAKKQTAADAKKRGFKDVKNYVNTMARYGGKSNYDKGRGLGT
tara:strand:+ start:22 stop:1221 length:1200 start_codon:yes stop_codon:yes gene_type:complete